MEAEFFSAEFAERAKHERTRIARITPISKADADDADTTRMTMGAAAIRHEMAIDAPCPYSRAQDGSLDAAEHGDTVRIASMVCSCWIRLIRAIGVCSC